MDRQFIYIIWFILTNFKRLDRTLRNSSQLRLPAEVLLLIVQASLPVYDLHPRQWNDELLRSCCLVCGAWRRICQEKLFENVILRSADQFDRLRSLKEIQSSAHLLTCIHRIIFHYKSPYYKLGEVIPRLVELYLPNLKSLEISSQSFGNDSPAFPIHHSFRRYTSRLSTVHFLKISRFKFTHLAEFRIFLGIFGGLRHLEVPNIQLGTDRQGDYRLLHRTQNQSLQVVTSTFYHADSVGRKYLLPIFWMNDRRGLVEPADVTSETITETLCPVLTPDAARLLVSIHELCQKGDKNVEWTCMDGKKQQCAFYHNLSRTLS